MLEVKGLTYVYGKRGADVLRDVSFSMEKGEIGVLLGPNGAGKSTILKCLGGINPIPEGVAFYESEDLAKLKGRERAKKITYVPQSPIWSHLSVYDVVMMGRLPYLGLKAGQKDKEKVEEALSAMGIEDLALRPVNTLSGGERQKVALARALAEEASLWLLDEPTSSLDLASQIKMVSLIREKVKKRGLSALLSMHDINLALALADSFYLLKDGVIAHAGGEEIITEQNMEELYGVKVTLLEGKKKKALIYGGNDDE